MQFNCVKKTCTKNWTERSLAQHRFPHQGFQFFLSVLCLLVRVTMVDKNKAVVCYLLATLAIMLSEKNAYFLCPKFQVTICTLQWTQGSPLFYSFWKAECLEMMPSWCRQVNWGNCGILWVNCAVFCVWKTTGKDSFEACAITCQNCAVYLVFPSGMTSHSKIAQFYWECIGRFTWVSKPVVIRKGSCSMITREATAFVEDLLVFLSHFLKNPSPYLTILLGLL